MIANEDPHTPLHVRQASMNVGGSYAGFSNQKNIRDILMKFTTPGFQSSTNSKRASSINQGDDVVGPHTFDHSSNISSQI